MGKLLVLCLNFALAWPLLAASKTIPLSSAPVANKTFRLVETMPESGRVPGHGVTVEGTHYLSVQIRGGILFMPILGGLNVTRKSNALAEDLKKGITSVDPFQIAREAPLAKVVLAEDPATAGIEIKPVVILQLCKDDLFRLSLTFQLEEIAQKNEDPDSKWLGRYTYHLTTIMTKEQMTAPSPELLQTFREEIVVATNRLYDLIQKDLKGALSAEDKPAKVGALHLIGDITFGSPKVFHVKAYLLPSEREDEIIFRTIKAPLDKAAFLGGLGFGIHIIRKDMTHTCKLDD